MRLQSEPSKESERIGTIFRKSEDSEGRRIFSFIVEMYGSVV